jgi:hypothetical protein
MSNPVVSVVVVAYNSHAHLAECLNSLLADTASPPFEIWVVDNASTDASAAIAKEYAARHLQIQFQRNAANRGYAGGLNSVLAHLRGEFVIVLNPDCIVEPGWLTPLVNFMHATPKAGALNPLILLKESEPETINAAGQDDHITGLGFNRLLWRERGAAGAQPQRVSGLHGSAVFLRRAVLERMGGWDESGFLYHEDVELSWLLQIMGYETYCVPESVVWHDYHLTMYPEKLYLLERNRLVMLLTHLSFATRLLLSPVLLLTEFMMWGYCLLRGSKFLQAKAASYRWTFTQTQLLNAQRQRVQRLRRITDFQLLQQLRWNYNWDQFFSLGRERGVSKRQPVGGMPVNLESSE